MALSSACAYCGNPDLTLTMQAEGRIKSRTSHILAEHQTQQVTDSSLLYSGVSDRNRDLVKLLLDNGCDPNEPAKYGLEKCAMFLCLVREDVQMAKLLVDAGFNVNIQDEGQCSALWHAVDSGNYEMVETLLQAKKVNVNLGDVTKLQPLHVAALHGHYRIIDLLLSHRANINGRQSQGSTPLMLACRAGCYKSVRTLILYGSDVNGSSYNGATALSTVLQNPRMQRDPKIIELLVLAGVNVNSDKLKAWKYSENLQVFIDFPHLYDFLLFVSETPRSLKLLSSIQVRNHVLKCRSKVKHGPTLQDYIKRLQIPTFLQDFILLKLF